jgi:hypothetical protein
MAEISASSGGHSNGGFNTGSLEEDLLLELAILSSLSIFIHYCFGLYGIFLSVVICCGIEHGAMIRSQMIIYCTKGYSRMKELVAKAKKKDILSSGNQKEADAQTLLEEHSNDLSHEKNIMSESTVASTSMSSSSSAQDENPLFASTLSLKNVLTGNQISAGVSGICVNSSEPIKFENELFVGRAFFFVRTNPEELKWKHLFIGKRRMFWIQLQGKFKKSPQGTVFIGGELPSRVTPGFFTRSIAHVIMGIIKQLVGKIHFSFGDSKNEEIPHVTFPLYQSVDQLVVTPVGEEPPTIGAVDFGETEEQRRLRRNTPVGAERYEVGATYTLHFHTMYVDLANWKTVNLPGINDMSLTSFFDFLPLRLVAYCLQDHTSEKHLQIHKDYLFNFELKHGNKVRVARRESDSSSESGMSSFSNSNGTTQTILYTNPMEDQELLLEKKRLYNQELAKKMDNFVIELVFWMEEAQISSTNRRVHYVFCLKRREDHSLERVSIVSAGAVHALLSTHFKHAANLPQNLGARPTPRFHSFHRHSRIGRYSEISKEKDQVVYALNDLLIHLSNGYEYNEKQTADSVGCDESDIAELHKVFDGPRLLEPTSYQVIECKAQLFEMFSRRNFLETSSNVTSPAEVGVSFSKRNRLSMQVSFEGVVYRFYNEEMLRQEVLVATTNKLLFYRTFSSSSDKSVEFSRVIGVQAIAFPFGSFEDGVSDQRKGFNRKEKDVEDSNASDELRHFAFCLQINTFAEEIVLCVSTEHARNTWIRVILQHCSPHMNFDRSLEEPIYICSTPSKSMKPEKRIVLNSRCLFPRLKFSLESSGFNEKNPVLVLVQKTLRGALRIHAGGQSVTDTLEFLNNASHLRNIDLTNGLQTHQEKLCFYLNLYHIVLAHGMISHGYPRSKSQWGYFMTHMCYIIGKEHIVMSLAEIEHFLIRARLPNAMSKIPHLSLGFLPLLDQVVDQIDRLGLNHPDFRVSFALAMNNCMDDGIVVFDADRVHDQLNWIMSKFLKNQVKVQEERNTIFLPRICEWYRSDFGGEGSALYCVRKLLGFLDESARSQALRVLDSPFLIHVKFGQFRYVSKESLQEQVVPVYDR